MNLEGRQGQDPIGFASQRKKLEFYSNCDGNHWMTVDKEQYNLKFLKALLGCLAPLLAVSGHGWSCTLRNVSSGRSYSTQSHRK